MEEKFCVCALALAQIFLLKGLNNIYKLFKGNYNDAIYFAT